MKAKTHEPRGFISVRNQNPLIPVTMKRKLQLILAACCLVSTMQAQNENKIWYFGNQAGIDFNSGSPVALTNGALTTADNSSAISDPAGNLQFYTNGVTVWNSQHSVMSNGTGLLGHQSGGQTATIVPHPGNPDLYYIFTCDAWAWANGIRYSIVDMSQQSGLGAVTATKNVVLYTPATEKVLAVKHCNGRDYWLITHDWNSNTFKVYLIDINGLNTTPVLSSVGSTHTGGQLGYYNAAGQLTISPNGDRLALAIFDAGIVEFLDFNNSTGQVSNPITLTGYPQCWGIDFSPNGRFVYLTRWGGASAAVVTQFDLSGGTQSSIQASATVIGNTTSPDPTYKSGYLKLAPDGKIYIAKWQSDHLAVVNAPDQQGLGCGFVDNGLYLAGKISQCGLCNVMVQRINFPSITVAGNCAGYTFGLSDITGLQNVSWNFGDPASGGANTSTQTSPVHVFTTSGTFTVQAIVNYPCLTDTFTQTVTVTQSTVTAQFTASTASCGSPVAFSNTSSGATGYQWDFGDGNNSTASAPSHTYSAAGTYTVSLIASGACGADTTTQTITIQPQAPNANFLAANGWCGFTITFGNLSSGGATNYQWDFGDGNNSTATNPSHTYGAAGTYTVMLIASSSCGSDTITHTASIQVQQVSAAFSASASACTGAPLSFSNTTSGATNYQWDFGDGNNSTASAPAHTYANAGTYTVTLIASNPCNADTVTQTVTVNSTPVTQISGTDTICQGQSVTLSASGGNIQWSGGSTSTSSVITDYPSVTTTYYAVASANGCSSPADTFTVYVTTAPVALITGPTTICQGQSTTLTANGGTSYQWSGGSTSTSASITVSPTSTTTYYVMPNSGACPGVGDTAVVTVLPVPVVNVGGNTTICSGQSTTLTATGGTFYQWSGGSTDTTASITVSPTVTTTYFVSTSNGSCSSQFATITVTVNPTPTVTIIGNTAICPGSSTTLTGMGATTYQWAGGIQTVGQTVTVTPTTNTNYFLIGYNSQGCADTTMVTITVYDPMTVTVLGPDTMCVGESIPLVCTGAGTFSWSPSTGLNNTNSANVIATPTATITYSVTVTDQNGCTGTDTFTLTVDACVGIEENASQSNSLIVYPNPGDGVFQVEWKQGGAARIDVYDVRGRLLRSEQRANIASVFTLDLGTFENGIYLLRVSGEERSGTQRVILSR